VPQGTLTAAQELTVTNDGSAPLVVSGVALDGADPTDYVITNFCLEPVLVSSSCSIDVRFAPQAAGASTATLTVATNDPSTPTAVSLSGTGGNLPQGPQGPPGTAGSNGAQGSPGPQGKQGPAGEIELVSCTPEKLKIHQHEKTVNKCTTRRVSGTVTFTTTTADQASIARGHVLYATGDVIDEGQGRSELMLVPLRVLRPGAYTLTYHPQVGKRRVARHMQIIIR
jgi:hypothetical protein